MEEGPTQEELKNVEEETKSSIEAYVAHYMSLFGDMWQTSEDIAAVILEAITNPNPHFRYLTNKGLETWVKEKYVDVTGDAPLEAMRQSFWYVSFYTDYTILDKLFELCPFMQTVISHENHVDSFS